VGDESNRRTTAAVFDDHLRRALAGDLEGAVGHNFAADVVLLTGVGEFRGHDGVHESRRLLREDLGDGDYEYLTRLTSGNYAFLEWCGQAEDVRIEDGADGFVIADGLIRMQWVHYTVIHRTGYRRRLNHAR
jgi:SnoaL-like domain